MTHEKQERIQEQGGATPGPWVERLDDNDQINIYGGENEQFWIALLPHQCVNSIEEEQTRNAKLIAAAPELLAVAIDAVRRCASLHGDSFETHKCPTCEPTRAAIAKALGYGAALRKAGRE